MRWAVVSEHDVDSGNRRCGLRTRGTARLVKGEPHDAVKSRGGRMRKVDREPISAAKGERSAGTPGEIRC